MSKGPGKRQLEKAAQSRLTRARSQLKLARDSGSRTAIESAKREITSAQSNLEQVQRIGTGGTGPVPHTHGRAPGAQDY